MHAWRRKTWSIHVWRWKTNMQPPKSIKRGIVLRYNETLLNLPSGNTPLCNRMYRSHIWADKYVYDRQTTCTRRIILHACKGLSIVVKRKIPLCCVVTIRGKWPGAPTERSFLISLSWYRCICEHRWRGRWFLLITWAQVGLCMIVFCSLIVMPCPRYSKMKRRFSVESLDVAEPFPILRFVWQS